MQEKLYYHEDYEKAIEEFENFLQRPDGFIENKIEACKQSAYSFFALSQSEKAVSMLFRSFIFDAPRAEICCDIGEYFFCKGDYHTSIFFGMNSLQRAAKRSMRRIHTARLL